MNSNLLAFFRGITSLRSHRLNSVATALWAVGITLAGWGQSALAAGAPTPKIQFTETYADTLVYDAALNETNIVTKATASLTAFLPVYVPTYHASDFYNSRLSCLLAGQALFDLDGYSLFVTNGVFRPNGTATITLRDDLGHTNGQVKVSWGAKHNVLLPIPIEQPEYTLTNLTIAWSASYDALDAVARYGGANETINDVLDFAVDFSANPYYSEEWYSLYGEVWGLAATGRNTNALKAGYWLDSGKVDAAPDFTPPTLKITFPSSNFETNAESIRVRGTVVDNFRVDSVSFLVTQWPWPDGEFQPVDIFTSSNWSTIIWLAPGTNWFHVRATDWAGNYTNLPPLPIFRSVPVQLTLVVNPPEGGSVSGLVNGATYKIGRGYSVTAKPRTGWILQSWTDSGGSEISHSPSFNFIMPEDGYLQANFIPNPFVSAKGMYRGLFYNQESLNLDNAGAVVLSVTTNGAYSAKLTMRNGAYPFAGQFYASADGAIAWSYYSAYTNQVWRSVYLMLDFASGQLSGSVDRSAWSEDYDSAMVSGQICRPFTNVSQLGRYTMRLNDGAQAYDSYASAVVNYGGAMNLLLNMADIAPSVGVASAVCADGRIPIFASLATKPRSIVMGWLILYEDGGAYLGSDNVVWAKPDSVLNLSAWGGRYINANGPGWTDGWIQLSGGNLSTELFARLLWDPGTQKFSFPEGNPYSLSLWLSSTSGLLSGSFVSPDTLRPIRFGGAALQQAGYGGGFFKELYYDSFTGYSYSLGGMSMGSMGFKTQAPRADGRQVGTVGPVRGQ